MKAYQKITIITLMLLVAIIIAICFGGIYKLQDYKVIKITPKYLLGMEFSNSKILNFEVDTTSTQKTIYDSNGNVVNQETGVEYKETDGYKTVEENVNNSKNLTEENYKISKNILIERLKSLEAKQYNIRQNENGNIVVEIPENDDSDNISKYLIQNGKFEIIDDETNAVLMDNSSIEKALIVYSSDENETANTKVYLQIKFNEVGTIKLEAISQIYVETKTELTETTGTTDSTKKVSIQFDGTTYMTTYFGETMTNRITKYSNRNII